MRSLHWHMQAGRRWERALKREGQLPAPEGGETVGLEEMVALRRRLTGAAAFSFTDGLDVAAMERMYEEFAAQTLEHGDWGIAYLGALGRNEGDAAAAGEEMRRAFGRSVSARYARKLQKRWEFKEAERRREFERFREAFPEIPEQLR